MPRNSLRDYPHLEFSRKWKLTDSTLLSLGECAALCHFIRSMPIDPKLQQTLRTVSFSRGAQATTAIEGNTLTDDELRKVLEGSELPKSREYQAQEVRNALEAMHYVWATVVNDGETQLVSPSLICELNRLVGKGLGPLYDGVPGKFRSDRRSVGRYLAPPPEHVPELVSKLCDWLRDEFGFSGGGQSMHSAIVEAVVAHVYFEWIHPFADGNGRTGRLIEFFILLRTGLPDVAAHVLANHYNGTRTEYAAHFDNARNRRDLSEFISYSVQGMLDGLRETVRKIQSDTWRIVWRSHVYDVFADYRITKTTVFKRRRELALSMPPDPVTPEKLLLQSEELVKQYMSMDRRTLVADLKELIKLGLIENVEGGKYQPAFHSLGEHLVGCAV